MGKYGQTMLIKLGKATSLEEGKLNSNQLYSISVSPILNVLDEYIHLLASKCTYVITQA